MKRRVGRFEFPQCMFHPAAAEDARAMFAGCIVLQMRDDLHAAKREVLADNPAFEEIEDGEIVPMYDCTFVTGEDGERRVEWTLQEQPSELSMVD